jgi:hypothetical protein
MTENAKNSAGHNTTLDDDGGLGEIQNPPEYNAENAKNPKEGADWLGGPQNGNETPSEAATSNSGNSINVIKPGNGGNGGNG